MSHLNLFPGALHTYVSDRKTDERIQHTVSRVLQVFSHFQGPIEIAWGRPIISSCPTNISDAQKGQDNKPNISGIIVYVNYYASGYQALSSSTLNTLQTALAIACGRSVTLYVTRLIRPFIDATALAYFITRQLKTKRFRRVINRLFGRIGSVSKTTPILNYIENTVQLPAGLVGMRVTLHGRIKSERARPRQTEQQITVGTLTTNKQQVIETSSATAINKKNVFTVKVIIVHLV
jgi:hypothetical protein